MADGKGCEQGKHLGVCCVGPDERAGVGKVGGEGIRFRDNREDWAMGVGECGEGEGAEWLEPHPFGRGQCIQQGGEGGEEVV